jgi:UDP-glucose 4-epimerase
MRVVVTGGGGFIGSHVVDQLAAAGHDVVVIDTAGRWRNPAAEYRDADLFDAAALSAAVAGAAAIFHLAGAADVNQVAADPADAVLLASTVWVYGATTGEGERTESAPVDLASAGHVYVATKLAAELLVHSYREMYGQQFTILRYGIPYGPRMRDALVVARFVQAARDGGPITIAGTGEQQRYYVYVEDLADAHVRALSPAAADQVLALEGGEPVSVREIADTVCRLVAPVPVRHVPARAADYQGVQVSGRLAKEVLDWAPVTPFEAGVRRYLDWLAGPEAAAIPSGSQA